jgi:hypothetical protein
MMHTSAKISVVVCVIVSVSVASCKPKRGSKDMLSKEQIIAIANAEARR